MGSPLPTLLVFVPGFLGNETSFATFPADVAFSLCSIAGAQRKVETKMFPAFDCKDSSGAAVANLVGWMNTNASCREYSTVVILAHSMGGLLAVDAHRQIRPTICNIIAIFTFDSPFFGLHTSHTITDVPTSLSTNIRAQLPDQETINEYKSTALSLTKAGYTHTTTLASSSYTFFTRFQTHARTYLPDASTALQTATTIANTASANLQDTTSRAYLHAGKVLPLSQASTLLSDTYTAIHDGSKSAAERVGVPFLEPQDAVRMSQEMAGRAYEGAVFGAKRTYEGGLSVYTTATKAVEKVPVGAAVVVGGTLIAAATGAAVVTAEAVATAGVIGGAAAVATMGVVGGVAVVGVAGVAGTVVAVKKVRSVMGRSRPTLTVVGGISDSEEEEEVGVVEGGGGADLSDEVKVEVDVVAPASAGESSDQVAEEAHAALESRLAAIQERKDQLEQASALRQEAIEARLNELTLLVDESTGQIVQDTQSAEVEFTNILYVNEETIALQDTTVEQERAFLPPTDTPPTPISPTTVEEERAFTPPLSPTTAQTLQTSLTSLTTTVTTTISQRPLLSTAVVTVGSGLLAAGAYASYYYSGGLISLAAPTVRSIAVGWAMKHATEAGKHLQFLYPLWGESRASCEARLTYVKECEPGFVFRCFYLELPPIPAVIVAAVDVDEKGEDAKGLKTPTTPVTTAVVRTFIKPPPTAFADLFVPVQMDNGDVKDVISAHMSMLRRTQNVGMYWFLVDETARLISARVMEVERGVSLEGN
ncbi:hypothetical protein HDU98_006184 [Podochytrium sp. JEL0797]|nr:hypothetical protein HDU98_006184 [Podochytrium sp. JEL0797]